MKTTTDYTKGDGIRAGDVAMYLRELARAIESPGKGEPGSIAFSAHMAHVGRMRAQAVDGLNALLTGGSSKRPLHEGKARAEAIRQVKELAEGKLPTAALLKMRAGAWDDLAEAWEG